MAQITEFDPPRIAHEPPILVTGGAGFIGANFIIDWLTKEKTPVINLDKLTYAGSLDNLGSLPADAPLEFVYGDIGDTELVKALLTRTAPRAIVHFAAESDADRSIHGPEHFITTNIVGTFRLLECARDYWLRRNAFERAAFRFLHVSTDEVYGSLEPADRPFCETSAYQPNGPYAASKAASDHMVRAWHRTYGLPVITTNCSNNYGPFQFPEKLIPRMIHHALEDMALPIYGDGMHIRDWLYVADHCSALRAVLRDGRAGDTYNIGGDTEKTNIEVVHAICDMLDEEKPRTCGHSYRTQIGYVEDRPGHDRRYAIDATKIKSELGWAPSESFESGLRKTIRWHLANPGWSVQMLSGIRRGRVERDSRVR